MTERTGTCVARQTRALTALGMVLAALLFITSLPIVHFYQGYWSRLKSLPTLVARRDQAGGGQWVTLAHVSDWVPKALIATEDRTFQSNLGISFEGIGRALLVDLRTHEFTQGGSTLTQQLARNMMLSPKKEFRRKVSEALLAVMITMLYSKRQILTFYLNEVYLGAGSWGIEAASRRYFGIPAMRLTLPEAALLAGLPQAPSGDNPLIHRRRAKDRQWEVLQSMVADNMISLTVARKAFREPLPLVTNPSE